MQKRKVTELTVIASLASTMVFSPLMPAMAIAATADVPAAEVGESGKNNPEKQENSASGEQTSKAEILSVQTDSENEALAADESSESVAKIGEKTYANLVDAAKDLKAGQTLQLIQNIDVSDSATDILFTAGTFDLNGHVLKAANTGKLAVSGEVTLADSSDSAKNGMGTGKIIATKAYNPTSFSKGIIEVRSGTLTMESGLIDCASQFSTNNADEGQYGIVVNNKLADASVVVNGGKIESGWYAVSGNGTYVDHQGTIVVNGGELISRADYAIFSPQAGGVEVNGGVVYGEAGGICMRRGDLKVTGGTVTSKGQGSTGDWGDGTGNVGNAAISVQANYGDVKAEITGGTVTAEGSAIAIDKNASGRAEISVLGGEFNQDVSDYVPAGNKMEKNADGKYTVAIDEEKAVAAIDGIGYDTLAKAIAAAKDGQTVKLMKDVTLDAKLSITGSKAITIDLNGHTVQNSADHAVFVEIGANGSQDAPVVTLTNSKTQGSVRSVANRPAVVVRDSGSLTLKDIAIDLNCPIDTDSYPAIQTSGKLTVELGAVVTSNEIGISVLGQKGSVTVNGGEIDAKSSALSGNGDKWDGTTIIVNSGTLKAIDGPAIYHPQSGNLTVNGGTLTGAAGIEMRAGDLKVSGNPTITATGAFSFESNGNGSTTTGAAIVIAQHTTKKPISVAIEGTPTISGEYAFLEHNPQGNDPNPAGQTTLSIKGGTFQGEVESKDGLTEFVSGGTFNQKLPDEFLADGFGMNEKDENGNYGVHQHKWATEFAHDVTGHWHVCSVCGEKSTLEKHEKSDERTGVIEATCGKDGYTGDVVCKDCGEVIELGKKVAATGKHQFETEWTVDAKSHWHACSVCGAKADEAEHAASKWTANDTDHWHICEVCEAPFDIDAHDFGDWKVTKEATVTEAGEREHTCKTCGKVVSEAIPALGEEKPADKPKTDSALPKTGDDSAVPVAAAGLAGAAAIAAGAMAVKRRKSE